MASAAEIEAALAGRYGPVRLSYRFEQRSASYAFEADLTAAVADATIDLDNNRPVVRTAVFTIDPERMPIGFNPSSDHIAVQALLLVPTYRSGTASQPPGYNIEEVTIAMGLFGLEAPRRTYASNGRQLWQVEASDLSALLLTAKTSTPYTVASGANYITAVTTVLGFLGLRHSFGASASVTPVAFTWGPGTPYLDIVNALLAGLNWYPIWCDATGVFTSRVRSAPESETANATYTTAAEPRLLVSPFEKSQDVTRWANRIACVIDDPRRTAAYALRVNNDATSVISVASLTATGQQPVVNSDPAISGGRVLDLTTADSICVFELKDRAIRSLPGVVTTFPDPRRGPREFYSLTIENVETAALWRAESWRYQIGGQNDMQHQVGKVLALTTSIVIAVSGTILTATEAQIVSGGRTILLTLPTGYTWVTAGATFNAERQGIINGLDSLGSEANGWNVRVRDTEVVGAVVRSSDTLVTITLSASGSYAITANETIVVTIPASAITGAPAVFAEPTFTVTAT